MIAAINLRLSKVVVFAILLVNVFVILSIISYLGYATGPSYTQIQQWTPINKLMGKASNQSLYDSKGYSIAPGNVNFKFINEKKKYGDAEVILKQNEKTYDSMFTKEINEPKDLNLKQLRPPKLPEEMETYQRANATIISLVRNSEAVSIGKSIRKFEKSFNSKFKYPYTFLNDQPFNDRFITKMKKYSDAPMEFIVIPKELWDKPDFIDKEKESQAMNWLQKQNIAYAKKGSYHNMCRFYLGNFYNVPELQKYKFYWRIEPDVSFFTDLNYDVFKYMEKTKKKYGFTINLYDIQETIASLWPETLKFLNKGDNYKYVNENGAFQWLLENQQNPYKNEITGGYSTCHFWSNFEIGDMDFFRSEAYNEWFKHLDSTGNFYYERWGDAPVHSVGLGLFADKKDIHWFRDIGYFHDPYVNCPKSPNTRGCSKGQFSRWNHLADQNCMGSWIDYSMDKQVY